LSPLVSKKRERERERERENNGWPKNLKRQTSKRRVKIKSSFLEDKEAFH